jgi:hypothetical protein
LKKDVFKEGYNGKQLSFLETLGSAAIAYVLADSLDLHLLTCICLQRHASSVSYNTSRYLRIPSLAMISIY